MAGIPFRIPAVHSMSNPDRVFADWVRANNTCDACDENALCTNTDGSFTCECNDGYSGDGMTCVEENENDCGGLLCDANATCIDDEVNGANSNFKFPCAARWIVHD